MSAFAIRFHDAADGEHKNNQNAAQRTLVALTATPEVAADRESMRHAIDRQAALRGKLSTRSGFRNSLASLDAVHELVYREVSDARDDLPVQSDSARFARLSTRKRSERVAMPGMAGRGSGNGFRGTNITQLVAPILRAAAQLAMSDAEPHITAAAIQRHLANRVVGP